LKALLQFNKKHGTDKTVKLKFFISKFFKNSLKVYIMKIIN
jgi:hypothetical protein